MDTDFVLAAEITDHPFHQHADELLRRLVEKGHEFALAPQMLAATFKAASISKIITNNARDYEVLGCFEIIGFR